MRTNTNVADGDTPPAGAGMNGQFDRNLFVFDRARTAEGLLFATHGDRARYLGQWSWEKPDWLKQNEGRYEASRMFCEKKLQRCFLSRPR
jgi:hypothetical protein